MELKTKQTNLKTLNKISRIEHNVKAIKEKSESFKDNLDEATSNRSYNSTTMYAEAKSKEISKEAAYQAKELAVKRTRKKMRLRTLSQKENVESAQPVYVLNTKRVGVRKKQRQHFEKTVSYGSSGISRLIKVFSFKRKPFISSDSTKYVSALLAGSIVVLMLFTIVFAGIFGGEGGSSFFGTFMMPFDNPESVSITSPYGYRIHPVYGYRIFHTGIDFGTPHHCNIYAVAIGEVTFAGVNGGYGNCVIIKHELMGDTLYTMYAHLSEIKVAVGQTVMQGEVIGIEGGAKNDPNHGTSTGHHLHFEVRNENNVPCNPLDYLPYNNK